MAHFMAESFIWASRSACKMTIRQLSLGLMITLGLLVSPSVFSYQPSLEQKQEPVKIALKSLQSGHKDLLNKNPQLMTVAMVYQPGCKWCKKQGEFLAKIQQQCGQYANIALVGADANSRQLKRELRHFDKGLLAYEANKQFLRKVNGIEAFPTTVVFDQMGNVIAKKRGYIPPEKLNQVMSVLTNQACQQQTLTASAAD